MTLQIALLRTVRTCKTTVMFIPRSARFGDWSYPLFERKFVPIQCASQRTKTGKTFRLNIHCGMYPSTRRENVTFWMEGLEEIDEWLIVRVPEGTHKLTVPWEFTRKCQCCTYNAAHYWSNIWNEQMITNDEPDCFRCSLYKKQCFLYKQLTIRQILNELLMGDNFL